MTPIMLGTLPSATSRQQRQPGRRRPAIRRESGTGECPAERPDRDRTPTRCCRRVRSAATMPRQQGEGAGGARRPAASSVMMSRERATVAPYGTSVADDSLRRTAL